MASSGMGSISEYFSNLDFDSTVVKTFLVRGQTYLEIPNFQTQNVIFFIRHTVTYRNFLASSFSGIKPWILKMLMLKFTLS